MADAAMKQQVARARRRRATLKAKLRRERRYRTLVTPEGAGLQLEIAPIGERITALMIDLVIILALLIGIGILLSVFSFFRVFNEGVDINYIVGLLSLFIIRNFYFALFEMGRSGATPGKRLSGLRVVSRDGGRLTPGAILARNILREVDLFLPLSALLYLSVSTGAEVWMALALLAVGVVCLIFPIFNRDRLRIGDLVGGTWVIRAPRIALRADLGADPEDRAAFVFAPDQLRHYGEHELSVLEGVLHNDQPDVLRAVADRIRDKIDWSGGADDSDAAFLRAFYMAQREALERDLLMGQRKRHKNDKTTSPAGQDT